MEDTALRPKPMPGQERRDGGTPSTPGTPGSPGSPGTAQRPHAARRRRRRLRTMLLGLFVGTVLVLSGVGLGTVGATVIGMSRLAQLRHQAPPPDAKAPAAPSAAPAPAGASLGVVAVDAGTSGALVVGVHEPGPAHTAGLVVGDVLLKFGRTRVDTAADLARAVSRARPGAEVTLTVRHRGGGYQRLTAVPGVAT
ncbi:PDZ domain-containing protein [Streptomyces sp. NPDC001177]